MICFCRGVSRIDGRLRLRGKIGRSRRHDCPPVGLVIQKGHCLTSRTLISCRKVPLCLRQELECSGFKYRSPGPGVLRGKSDVVPQWQLPRYRLRRSCRGKDFACCQRVPPEWKVIVSRHFRGLQQSDLVEPMPRQGCGFLAVDRSRRTQHPHVGLHDQALEMFVSLRVLHKTIQKAHLSARRHRPERWIFASVCRSLVGSYSGRSYAFS
jgi:hypothetical protein